MVKFKEKQESVCRKNQNIGYPYLVREGVSGNGEGHKAVILFYFSTWLIVKRVSLL